MDTKKTAYKFAARGHVGVILTDTVYGLAAVARDAVAVKKLYDLKSRERKPGTIIAASIDQLVELGLKRRYLKSVEQFWPSSISVIIPTSNPELDYLDMGVGSLAVRVVKDQNLLELLNLSGPLLTSSANLPSMPPSTNISEAKEYFGNKVDFYIDGGDSSGRLPSTIIRIVDDTIEIVRQGKEKINY